MMDDMTTPRGSAHWLSPRFALFTALIFVAACSTESCDCEGFEVGTFPQEHHDKTLPSGGQLRLTESGLDFMEGQVPNLIGQFQPEGLSFCVPSSEGTVDVCNDSTCTDGSDGCQLDLEIDDTNIIPEPTDTLLVDITIGGIGGKDANGDWLDVIDVGAIGANCDLRIWHKDNDKSKPAQVSAKLPITFSIDSNSATRDVRIEVGEIQMEDFTSQVNYEIKGRGFWGTIACGGANLIKGMLNSTVNGMIKDQLGTAIDGITNEQLCRACGGEQPACPGNATCGDNGGTQSCMYASGECVPRTLGIEGALKLGQLIGDYSQNPTAEVDVMAKLADMATVDTGVNLGLRIGAQPPEFGRCVPVDPTLRPAFDAIPPSPELLANSTPGGQDFMVGIGVHKRALEHVLWSVWGGGVLCMKIDSAQVSQLSTSTLGVFLPSITKLAGNDAMAFLQLAPQTAPQIELGANTVTPTEDSYTIDDGLIHLSWKDVDVHFYVYAHDRNVRVFTLRVDIALPVALASDGQGSIIPVLGDLESAVQNIRPVKTELLAEDPQVVIDLIPTLVGLALPSLAGSISEPIELPEVFGYRISLDQDDITSVDNKSMIALYADLVPVAQPVGFALQTRVTNTELDLSQWTDSGVPRPVAILDVVNDLPDFVSPDAAMDIEYSWRVNGGVWSMYQRSERLEIQDPTLVLQGTHRIEVRARFRGDNLSTEKTPATTYVRVDYDAPALEIERNGALVSLAGADAVDKADEMTYRYRIVDGEGAARWSAWSPAASIDLLEVDAPAHFRLIAQVQDRAGHISEAERNIVWDRRDFALDRANTPADGAKSGCSAASGQSPVGTFAGLLAMLAAFLLLRRRRRAGRKAAWLVALSLVGLVGLTGCDDDPAKSGVTDGKICEPGCADNEVCMEGTCQLAEGACSEVGDCEGTCETGEVATCGEDGMCACVPSCEAGCGDDQFCCFDTNACQDLPDPCSDEVCEPGFEPSVVSRGTGDSETCEVSGQSCECVALPPLSLGVYGLFTSLAEHGETRAVSAYNQTYTDLMVATVDAGGQPTWYFVDGLPESGDITGDISGPRGGIAKRGPNVGTHTAIGVDAQAGLHVLYRDEDNKSLKYARGTKTGDAYTFATKTLNEDGDSGLYPSVLIADGTLHAVYSVNNFADPDAGWQSQLRYINFPVDAPLDSLEPQAEVLASSDTADPCGNSCIGTQVCVTSGSASCVIPTRDCGKDACANTEACVEGSCEPKYVKLPHSYPIMAGVFSQLSATADGLAVTFYDDLKQQVGWARRTGETWAAAQYLGRPSGPYVSGAFDADGKLHLAYMDTAAQQLIYEQVGEGVREVVADGVRDSADGYILADIGEDVDLKLHADGSVSLLYQDATWHRLILATRTTAGAWSQQTLAEPGEPYSGAHGFFATMLRAPGSARWAVDFVLNSQATPPAGDPAFHTLP